MEKRRVSPQLPREVIDLKTYDQLELYLSKFSAGELGLVLLLGRYGTGKSDSVRRALCVPGDGPPAPTRIGATLYVEGHMQPFGLYRQLWEHRNGQIVLDDLDRLYAEATVCVCSNRCVTQ